MVHGFLVAGSIRIWVAKLPGEEARRSGKAGALDRRHQPRRGLSRHKAKSGHGIVAQV